MESTTTPPPRADVQIVPYAPERADEVAALLNAGLAKKAVGVRDADYWRWKHEQNPFGASFMLLAECDGRLAGVRAFMRWQFEQCEQTIGVAKPVDTVTHPDFQRRGIFSKLTLETCEIAARDGIAFLFNTPNDNSLPAYLKLGWQIVGELPVHVRWRRPVATTLHVFTGKFLGRGTPSEASFFRVEPVTAAQVIEQRGLENLLEHRQRADGRLETRRTVDFLRWRYAGHPHIRYYAEVVQCDDRIDGVLFYRTNVRHGAREIMIDDVILRAGAEASVDDLLSRLKRRTRADYWAAQAPAGQPLSGAKAFRFRPFPRRSITLAARPLQQETPLPGFDEWSLGFGDIEGL